MWPVLTILTLVALAALHIWWRKRFLRAQAAALNEIQQQRSLQEKTAVQLQTQQEALFDSMVEGLLLLDESGRIKLANRAFITLFDLQADIRGKTILEALRLHELAELVDVLASGGQVLGHQMKLSGPSEHWLQINGAAILNRGGRHGTLLVFHDLTRLKRLERTREEFVANVSHELRTPLSLNAERLRLLIEDLLTISELESGRVKLNLQTVALQPLVAKVFSDLQSRAATKRIEFHNQAADLTVLADTNRLEQVLGNLIDNAIKYGRSEGTITVGARATAAGLIETFVQDDGPGIPTESLERLFERFYRVDKARSREQGGTGLGLSIVKHIVQNHGGKVWASSEPGKGATFFFTLPQA